MRRGLGGRAGSSSGRMMDSAVLSTYKSELREFRALQEELEPWTAAFKAKNDRKPCLADVESTRAPPAHHMKQHESSFSEILAIQESSIKSGMTD